MRILITNASLAGRTGTELYVRDLALALQRRGHRPVVFAPVLGVVADSLRSAGVTVTDRPTSIAEPPDVIHGHHTVETFAALVSFPGVPALSWCHDALSVHDAPVIHPRVRRWVAVDDACRDRLVAVHGVAPADVVVVPNAVDLARFKPRNWPLPDRPVRALLFNNNATSGGYLDAVAAACERERIVLDIAGSAYGTPFELPEDQLGEYDIAFAKARCALEALAVGCAVVCCGPEGIAGMVRADDCERLLRLNFGRRALGRPVTEEAVSAAIGSYDADDAAKAAAWVRMEADLEPAVDRVVALYEEVIGQQRELTVDPVAEQRALVEFLTPVTAQLVEVAQLRRRTEEDQRGIEWLRGERDALELERARVEGELLGLLATRTFRARRALLRLLRRG